MHTSVEVEPEAEIMGENRDRGVWTPPIVFPMQKTQTFQRKRSIPLSGFPTEVNGVYSVHPSFMEIPLTNQPANRQRNGHVQKKTTLPLHLNADTHNLLWQPLENLIKS